jgi:hypothetical protein
MTIVDGIITNALPNQVSANGKTLQIVFIEDIPTASNVTIFLKRLVNFEMIAPAGELEAIEAPLADLLGQGLQGQVSPLARE